MLAAFDDENREIEAGGRVGNGSECGDNAVRQTALST